MKTLFAIILGALAFASLAIFASFPEQQNDRPVLYWVSGKNPAREQQLARFEAWLVKQGHVDESGNPALELRLDMANSSMTKQTIQSVSGVAGDLMDTSEASMRLFAAMGVIADVTDDARTLGFDPSQTYPAIRPGITIDGRQYAYPANVANAMLWVNVDAFRSVGLEPPPRRWTWEEFEDYALRFQERANPPGTAPQDRRFIVGDIPVMQLARCAGVSILNETMTACALDDPRYVKTLKTKRRWVYELNILPTPDDEDAFSSQQGFGGSKPQLFGTGQYAMIYGGRWLLVQFRRFDHLGELQVVEFPHDGFPSTTIRSRGVVLYQGSDHPELAKLFLAYLASEDYNRQIVEDADALPPNLQYTQSEAFLRPAAYPNEWKAHRVFSEAAQTIAVSQTLGPYILPSTMERRRLFYEERFLNGLETAADAATLTARDIDRRIAAEIGRKPELSAAYEQDLRNQAIIDQLKAAGQPIPENLITNPYHRALYARNGRLKSDATGKNP